MTAFLRISIVCYASDKRELWRTLHSLQRSCEEAINRGYLKSAELMLVDNGPGPLERKKIDALLGRLPDLVSAPLRCFVLGDGTNIGFGRGHNLTFDVSACDFHLVLNPDTELTLDAVSCALQFMRDNDACGALAPSVVNLSGEREYLCKRYPALFDFFLRGFAPHWLRKKNTQRLAYYEMRDMPSQAVYWDPPIIGGCFMLLRSSVLEKIAGFDPDYFLYFEDFDLSLRVAEVSRIAYVPTVKIMHAGGGAARKGLRHIWLFSRSAFTFFNRHGWRLY
ncbi:MAG: glycosyltransferase family 2 protein [Spongiibacteraceae bacterium]